MNAVGRSCGKETELPARVRVSQDYASSVKLVTLALNTTANDSSATTGITCTGALVSP